MKTEYGNPAKIASLHLKFVLCTLGGDQFGGKEDALKALKRRTRM